MAQALRRTMLYELIPPLGAYSHLRQAVVDPQYAGVVVNIPHEHWFAIRFVNNHLWKLDSRYTPGIITATEYGGIIRRWPLSYLIRKLGSTVAPAGDTEWI